MKPSCPLAILVALLLGSSGTVLADDKPPITAEDLKMTAEPLAPGAPAIILYRQVDRDDSATTGYENYFVRIKIFKEDGRKYADVEIPYYRESGDQIAHIWGRTVHADGSVAEFKGTETFAATSRKLALAIAPGRNVGRSELSPATRIGSSLLRTSFPVRFQTSEF